MLRRAAGGDRARVHDATVHDAIMCMSNSAVLHLSVFCCFIAALMTSIFTCLTEIKVRGFMLRHSGGREGELYSNVHLAWRRPASALQRGWTRGEVTGLEIKRSEDCLWAAKSN